MIPMPLCQGDSFTGLFLIWTPKQRKSGKTASPKAELKAQIAEKRPAIWVPALRLARITINSSFTRWMKSLILILPLAEVKWRKRSRDIFLVNQYWSDYTRDNKCPFYSKPKFTAMSRESVFVLKRCERPRSFILWALQEMKGTKRSMSRPKAREKTSKNFFTGLNITGRRWPRALKGEQKFC